MAGRKKICFICYREFPDTNFEHYSRVVSESGYEVTVVSYLMKGQAKNEVRGQRKIVRFEIKKNVKSRMNRLLFVCKVSKFLKRNQFSIIHIHNSCAYFGLIRLLCWGNRKFVYHITSYPIGSSLIHVYKEMTSRFVQCLLMNVVIVQSDELKYQLIGIRSLRRTGVVPVGFDRKLFYPLEETLKGAVRNNLGIPRDAAVLVYCGAMAKRRELDRLLEAFRKVQLFYDNLRLLMIGDGDAVYELKELAKTMNIQDKVIFMGRVKHEAVRNFIGAADVAISYIPINENYNYNPPLKTFEYLACGLPTIATKTESNRRIIRDCFNGVLVSDDAEDLSGAIVDLLNNKEKLNLLKNSSSKSIVNFDFELITKTKLLPIYERLMNETDSG